MFLDIVPNAEHHRSRTIKIFRNKPSVPTLDLKGTKETIIYIYLQK